MGKILIAYFSRTGISKALSRALSVKLGADLFSINPAKSYPTSYVKCIFDAKIEQMTNARPLTMGKIPNIDKYSTIVLVYPIWWHTCPNIVLTFLEENNLKDKVIIPVCTYGSSGKGHSIEDMQQVCPEANFHNVIEATAFKADAVAKVSKKVKELAV